MIDLTWPPYPNNLHGRLGRVAPLGFGAARVSQILAFALFLCGESSQSQSGSTRPQHKEVMHQSFLEASG